MSDLNSLPGNPVSGSSELMAAWLASGGAVEALPEADVGDIRSRQGGLSRDEGLQAGFPTNGACAEDELRAGFPTSGKTGCSDDGLGASRYTTYGACAEDELRASFPTSGKTGCVDEGWQASRYTTYGACADDGFQLQGTSPTSHPLCQW